MEFELFIVFFAGQLSVVITLLLMYLIGRKL